MNISILVDSERLREYEQHGSLAFFTIYLEHNGRSYPSDTWMDFGTIVLGWWMTAVTKLIRGESSQELYFMDGPFKLTAELANNHKTITCSNDKENISWTFSLAELVSELREAANHVIRHLSIAGVYKRECESLQLGLNILAKAVTSGYEHV